MLLQLFGMRGGFPLRVRASLREMEIERKCIPLPSAQLAICCVGLGILEMLDALWSISDFKLSPGGPPRVTLEL